jgi:NAD(P)H-dependent nitrite reductase small subunit
MSWIRITEENGIPLREGRCVKVGKREIAVFHLPKKFFAVDNLCPHNQGPLCDGIVKGTTVVCPLHAWNISLETGQVVKPDVPVSVRTYPVRIREGIIEIDVSDAAREETAA